MPLLIGLTGSIGMGKTTTARMFAEAGIPVWDADAAVHRLYAKGGPAVAPLSALHADALINGAIDRARLKAWIKSDPGALKQIERIVHPLVAEDRKAFIAASDTDIVLLDIPLLFETGADRQVDAIVTVTVPPETQQARVLARPGMDMSTFQTILSRQTPDAEKRARADYVIETDTIAHAKAQVQAVLADIRSKRLA